MATSLIVPVAASVSSSVDESRYGIGFPKTSFVCASKLFSVVPSPSLPNSRGTQSQELRLPLRCHSITYPQNSEKRISMADCERRKQALYISSCHRGEMASEDGHDDRLARISSAIRVIPNFPKPGIMFQDITTLLLDPKAFKDTIDLFVERYRGRGISVVAGIEARGFIFGPPIALAIGAKFVPMRKPKKLPGEVISEEYSLEYGTDRIEMHVGAVQKGERALVIDDLIATGGTLCAAMRLLERVGVEVVECACVIELPELKGRDRLENKPLFVLVSAV